MRTTSSHACRLCLGQQWLQIALFAIVAQALAAQQAPPDYCSLVVRVINEQDSEIDAPVSVREVGGTEVESEYEVGGARFCNLGILPVTVKVGRPESCHYTIIHNVPLAWQETRTIVIKHEVEPCERHLPPPPKPLCQLLIRVVDQNGVGLPATVEVNRVNRRAKETYQTDRVGRARVLMESGSALGCIVRVDRFLPKQIDANCTLDTPRMERIVVLSR